MAHPVLNWILVVGFVVAGFINAIGTVATRRDFARWGYPAGWGMVTGAMEILSAALIAHPASREAGLALAAAILVAAVWTVLRHRDWSHLAPLGVFVALVAAVQIVG